MAHDEPLTEPAEPGTVLEASKHGLVVAAGDSPVRLLELGPAGRKRMSAGAFVNGSHAEPGERLG
jgi:methionyl-tRNA formyltransferase